MHVHVPVGTCPAMTETSLVRLPGGTKYAGERMPFLLALQVSTEVRARVLSGKNHTKHGRWCFPVCVRHAPLVLRIGLDRSRATARCIVKRSPENQSLVTRSGGTNLIVEAVHRLYAGSDLRSRGPRQLAHVLRTDLRSVKVVFDAFVIEFRPYCRFMCHDGG